TTCGVAPSTSMSRRVKYGGSVTTDRLLERITRCVTGLALFGVGISLQIESRLGNPPWDTFHQGVANQVGLGIGTVIILTGIALLVLFWIPLRQKPGLGTVLNALEIGLVANVALDAIPRVESMAVRTSMLVGGILLVALGSALYIGSGLGPGPRDGIMTGLAERGVKIRVARTIIEVTVLVVGWLLGGQVGVGTVLFAVAIGPLVQPLLPRLTVRPRTSSGNAPA
ncbi:MAG: YczE/YyaS/YitT family protein, partial [Ilumatobacteraceae bacterium]